MSQIVRALDNGWLRGAALDVFPEEPLPPQSVLWDHPKIIGRSFSSTKLRNSFPKLIAKTKLLWTPNVYSDPFQFPFSLFPLIWHQLQWSPIPSDPSCCRHVEAKRHRWVLPAKPGQVKRNQNINELLLFCSDTTLANKWAALLTGRSSTDL